VVPTVSFLRFHIRLIIVQLIMKTNVLSARINHFCQKVKYKPTPDFVCLYRTKETLLPVNHDSGIGEQKFAVFLLCVML
jgi:hypothetical protein